MQSGFLYTITLSSLLFHWGIGLHPCITTYSGGCKIISPLPLSIPACVYNVPNVCNLLRMSNTAEKTKRLRNERVITISIAKKGHRVCKRAEKAFAIHCALYTVHCTLYTVHCTLYTVQCIHRTLCTPYTEHTVHCTQCTLVLQLQLFS